MVRVHDDFDNAINEEWKKNNPIPEIYPRYTNFTILHEELEKLKITICQDTKYTLLNKLYNLYKNQDDEKVINFIQEYINVIHGKDSKQELIDYLLHEIINGNYILLHICHSGTERNPLFQIPHFTFGGLSMPDQSYYTERTELQEPFIELIKKQFDVCSVSYDNIDLNFVWELEKQLASYHYTNAEKREPLKTYHPTTMKAFKKMMHPYFNNIDNILPNEYYDIVLNNDSLFEGFVNVLETYSLEQLKLWFTWRIIKKYGNNTTNDLYNNLFDFYSRRLNGVKTQRSLDKRAAGMMEGMLEDMFTKLYLEDYVEPSLKKNFSVFVEELRDSLRIKMEKASWMCKETKENAIDKLNSMTLKTIGPVNYKNYNHFDKDYSCFLEFINDYSKWDWDVLEVKEKMYKLRDANEWLMSGMTINAYYHPSYNEIVFPAGILQPPFYGVNQTFGENAGGIGAVIAHEMTHGFDDQGSRYDKNGYLYNWWSKETRKEYETIIKKMEEHFDTLTYEDKPLNSKLTQGENLADLGGLQTALSLCKTDEDKKDCLISWAKIWRANSTKEFSEKMLVVDPHSPPHLRINAIVQHISDFYRLFNVEKTDKMYLEPERRCMLWSE